MPATFLPRLCASLVVAMTVAAGAAEAADPEWDRKYYDPGAPVDGQIVLPTPRCGGVVFVPIATLAAADDPLLDQGIWLGGVDETRGYMEYYRRAFIRGGFTVDERNVYYIAKYELTIDQWDAVMTAEMDDCLVPNAGGARPKAGVSWFEAVEFTRVWSEWVRRAAPDLMPSEEGALSYVRLPTEVEWEYAARGGSAVDEAAYREALPPMEGSVSDYAWHSGRDSSSGALRPIGRKKPNPLGLHGMFGGVEELVLEPFRMNRFSRLHGQIGGFVTRGGSIDNPREELRSALRSEWPFFQITDGRATRQEWFGLRPAISIHVNSSLQRQETLREAWSTAMEPETDDPLEVLDEVMRDVGGALRSTLQTARAGVVDERRERAEISARALRQAIESVAISAAWRIQIDNEVQDRTRTRDALLSLIDPENPNGVTDLDKAARIRDRAAREEGRLRDLAEDAARIEPAIVTSLRTFVEDHSAEEFDIEARALLLHLQDSGRSQLAEYAARVISAARALRRNRDTDPDELLRIIIPQRRE